MEFGRLVRTTAGIAALGLAGAALGACTNATTVGNNDMSHLLSPALVAHATRSGELATTIYGNPFAPGPVNDATIAADLKSPPGVPPFRFTTRPGASADPNYRLVLAFDPPKSSYGSDDAACAPNAKSLLTGGARPANGPTAVVATFCADTHFVSQTTLFGPASADSNSPAFRKLMSDTITYLFPFDAMPRLNLLQGGGGGAMQ